MFTILGAIGVALLLMIFLAICLVGAEINRLLYRACERLERIEIAVQDQVKSVEDFQEREH